MKTMILIALGANLSHPRYGKPRATLEAALRLLAAHGVTVVARSRLYLTKAVGPGVQRPYLNAVALVDTDIGPVALLALLHRVEALLGRKRRRRWAARLIDLDLIDYHGVRLGWASRRFGRGLILPHPRISRRAFVLAPLRDVAPSWRHPVTAKPVSRLLAALDGNHGIIAVAAWRC